jgi:FKBP-type peptidyl-prolyl cis-trans isomerase FkpA
MKLITYIVGCLAITLFLNGCNNAFKRKPQYDKKTENEAFLKANKGLVSLDQERIDAYVTRRGWQMEQTKTGMWYQIYEHGSGEQAKVGFIANLKYSVSLLDGTICYTSDSLGIMHFRIGQGGVESGLEEAILLMRVGDKARFIMPPHLAHGLLGDEKKIPPRSTIVYHAELINLTTY